MEHFGLPGFAGSAVVRACLLSFITMLAGPGAASAQSLSAPQPAVASLPAGQAWPAGQTQRVVLNG